MASRRRAESRDDAEIDPGAESALALAPARARKTGYRNRIVGHGDESPDQLLANPRNFRIHPKHQENALTGILSDVGWVATVLVNRRTGFVIDGHLRVAHAISRNEPSIPVTYVDLDDDEEAKVLASLDPISALAGTDRDKLDDLLNGLSTDDDNLNSFLDRLRSGAPDDAWDEWKGMPEFDQQDKTAFHTVLVHFDSISAINAFAALVEQAVSDATKFIWYPKKPRQKQVGTAFDDELDDDEDEQ